MNDLLLRRAVAQFQTPLYVFDEVALLDRIAYLRTALPSRVQLCYAVKANTFITAMLVDAVERVESCSPGETRICASVGVPPEKMVVSGVHKNADMLREAHAHCGSCGRYTVESLMQFELLRDLARETGAILPVLLRLSSGNQFGMEAPELERVVEAAMGDACIEVCGLQFFSGTQVTSTKRIARELGMLDKYVGMLQEVYGCTLRELEYGPGLPVSYFDATRAEDEPAHLAELGRLLEELSFDGEVVLEIGRGIAASCGTYLTSVVDAKKTGGVRYAIVDGGKHQLAYYGQGLGMHDPLCHVLERETPSSGAAPRDEYELSEWVVAGSLCTANDVLAKSLPAHAFVAGDVIAFEQAGAYCATEGFSLFLSRDLAAVVLADAQGGLRLVRDHIETAALNTPSKEKLQLLV